MNKFPDFSKTKVLVVGDIMLDQYYFGDCNRVSPEAPVVAVNIKKISNKIGAAGNVALNLNSLKVKTYLLGVIGQDKNAKILKDLFKLSSVHTNLLEEKDAKTITKLRVLSKNQQLIRLDFEDSVIQFNRLELEKKFKKIIKEVDSVLFSDYGKGTLLDIAKLIQIAKKYNKKVFVDPKGNDFTKYKNSTLISPNLSEFEQIVGKTTNEEVFIKKAKELRKELEIENLLVTRSEDGMSLFNLQTHHRLFAQKKEVIDVTGAGDTAIATVCASMSLNLNPYFCVELANSAAAIVVDKIGTSFVTPQELQQEHYKKTSNTQNIELNELLLKIKTLKSQKQKIVFTNGCFDILHSGHVAYLNEAATLGDILIVALNSDQSIRKLKGKSRPINKLKNRKEVIAGLKAVDYVIDFNDDTPIEILKKINPDFLVKGADYTEDQVVGADYVKSYGGQIKLVRFFDEISTSKIIESVISRG